MALGTGFFKDPMEMRPRGGDAYAKAVGDSPYAFSVQNRKGYFRFSRRQAIEPANLFRWYWGKRVGIGDEG